MSKSPVLGHRARKRFGQNFLHDKMVINNIVRHIRPEPGQLLVEIGPGMGAITELLLAQGGGHLHVVELDKDLIPILRTKFFNYPGFQIHEGDALKFPLIPWYQRDKNAIDRESALQHFHSVDLSLAGIRAHGIGHALHAPERGGGAHGCATR